MKHSDSSIVRHITTGLVLFVIFGLAFITIRPFIMVIIVAAILAAFLSPLYNLIYNYLKRKSLSAFLTICVFVLTITIPFLIFVRSLIFEAQVIVNWYAHGNGVAVEELIATIESVTGEIPFVDIDNLKNEIGGLAKESAKWVGAAALKTGSFVINLFIVVLVMFFILVERERTKTWLMEALPLDKRHAGILWKRATDVISQTVRGNLLVMLVQTVIGISGMVIAGATSPVLLGSLFGILSIIPAVGSTLVWAPTALFLYITGNTSSAIFLVIWCFITNFLVDNYISPKIIGGSTKMHQVVILFSVLGGIRAFGIVGIILGPTIIALAMVALDIVKELAHGKSARDAITEN
jgi:predicted PurR-regulated permease PerM